MSGQWYDANISIPGCDKNMPGCLIAMGRLNRPSLMIYGGTIKPGYYDNEKIDIISAFQSYGEFISGNIDDNKRSDIVKKSCPGAGACGGMYTANTMASAIEAMGMSLPYSSSTPAVDLAKQEECFNAGEAIKRLLEKDIKPRDIMTRDAFENAMVLVTILGGSTNAELTIDDFQLISDRTPYVADLKPSGQHVMEDLHKIGGTPAVMKFLLENDLINGDCLTVTGKTIKENLSDLPGLTDGQKIIFPRDNPIKPSGHIRILKGNLAPGGSVAKITGKEGEIFTGPAKVYDSEEAMLSSLENNEIIKGDVIIIRYEGPKGGPGMPEMLTPTSVPEAQEGGPIAIIKNGDIVTINAKTNKIEFKLSDKEFANRQKNWKMPPYKANRGTLYKYIKNVKTASEGCVTDE